MYEDTKDLLESHLASLLLLDLGEWILHESEVIQSIGRIRREYQQEVQHHNILSCEIKQQDSQDLYAQDLCQLCLHQRSRRWL